MIPYLHPEFIAVLLENQTAVGAAPQTDPKSTAETSLRVLRPQPAAKVRRGPVQWQVSWSRFLHLVGFAAILAILWFL